MKYRKKPLEVDAESVLKILDDPRHVTDWVMKGVNDGILTFSWSGIHINTLEGTLFAPRKNWMLVCGIKGEIYPVRIDIFNETYEKI